LSKDEIYIAEDRFEITETAIGISRRIGVESSGDAALKPYRFYLRGNSFVSSYPNK
jgi:DNA-3-methyladenine glycosylase